MKLCDVYISILYAFITPKIFYSSAQMVCDYIKFTTKLEDSYDLTILIFF